MKASSREVILYLALKHNGDWQEIYQELFNHSIEYSKEVVDEKISKFKGNYITIVDSDYPEGLKQIYKPPFVLFYEGDIKLLNDINNNLCVRGTRQPSEEGKEMAEELLTNQLGKNLVIGVSQGIDEIALNSNNKIIGVLGCGINYGGYYGGERLTERVNQITSNNGLVVSEYPNDIPPTAQMMLSRTRIMVGLASKVLMLESKKNSNSNVIVSLALDRGRDVMVVPTSPLNKECSNNKFIYEGAIPIIDRETLEEQLVQIQ